MAKSSFSPVLCILLTLIVRADLQAADMARYPGWTSKDTESRNTGKTITTSVPASRWKSPQPTASGQSATEMRRTFAANSTVDYEISGEAYENQSYADRERAYTTLRRRTTNPGAMSAREYADEDYEAEDRADYAEHQVDYEEVSPPYEDGMEYGDPDADYKEGYMNEMYPEELWGDEAGHGEEYHSAPARFFHWLGTFRADHGYWFRTSKNSPRHLGIGKPLKGTSWLNRPSSIGFFAGILNGDTLIQNRVDQGSGLFGGLRLGWDFDHYWGVEARAGWSSPAIEYTNVPPDRIDGIFLCDADILYYPWGDAACRPYALIGMGMARFNFTDDLGDMHDEYLLGIPLGIGFKYQYHPNLAFRAEFLDNTAWGSKGLNNMNNLSFSLGMEFRFGGKPPSYYPWQPAKYIW